MAYHVVTRWGGTERSPNEPRMREILAQLDERDSEHPDTWLTHESGWTLTVSESGRVTWDNMEGSGETRHLVGVSREKALSLWLALSRGDIAAVQRESWRAGHSPPLSDEARAQLAREAEEATRSSFLAFYESLGPERTELPCRHAGCRRGAVRFSVFCRVHHFENIHCGPCPFPD